MSRNLKSPVSGLPLKEMDLNGLKVDVGWKGCGGIWFDKGELELVDEAHEAAGEALLNIPIDKGLILPERMTRRCPVDGAVMTRYHFGQEIDLEIDECPECGGIWLDGGELQKIRDYFESEAHRREAQKLIDQKLLGDKKFEAFLSRRGRRGRKGFARLLKIALPHGVVAKF
jgi:hypothetical protein